jgi:hypothetical protein
MLAAMVALALCAQPEAPKKWAVHEWGTFTSVSDGRGGSVQWAPFLEQSDLPGFVRSSFRSASGGGKSGLYAHVRMETPVIYFYSDEDVLASARVRFPNGQLTEWYPSVLSAVPYGDEESVEQDMRGQFLDWGTFRVRPHASDPLPDEHKPSHYYAAREVDAAELSVCTRNNGKLGYEHEKFLFYRGVGSFEPPLAASFDAKTKGVTLTPRGNLGEALLFERQGSQVGLKRVTLDGERHLERVVSGSSVEAVKAALVERLEAAGLYEKEAKAMVKTWNDSWFEPGLRVFYVEPVALVDAQLPLDISPKPRERVRVIVGRLELFTPARVDAVVREVAEAPIGDVFAKEGRFLDAILAVAAANASATQREQLLRSRAMLMNSRQQGPTQVE